MHVEQFEKYKNISINPELAKVLLKWFKNGKFTINTGKHEWHSKTMQKKCLSQDNADWGYS